ncbi:MAG TPA: DUF2723 domain-containing protein [Gemmatimonadales bacterium]|nr:DUF2723 domain-containing protein [Gemmatimonadales bacterium]
MNDTQTSPPYRWAALAGAAVMALYIATLAPTTAFWDTSEYIAAAKVLGIPHPPGNPLFTLMAHVWGMLPLAADYAVRINLFAAATSAASAALWFLVLERWLTAILPQRGPRLLTAAAGVLVSATAWTVWNQSTVNEKVYTVSMFSIALVMWLVVRWADLPVGPRRDRMLIAIGYILALTSTNHLMGILVISAVGVYILLTDWKAPFRPWVLAGLAGAFVVGLSLNYVYLPMRAAQYPPINEGEPVCGSILKAVTGGCQDLSDVLNRVQYGKPSLMDRQAPLLAQMGQFVYWFGWQWGRDWGGWSRLATGLFTLLGVAGFLGLWEKDRRAALSALALFGTLSVALVFYMNFKYGYSQYLDRPDLVREVRERDYFFVGAFAFWGVLAGLGLGVVWRFLAETLAQAQAGMRKWAVTSPVLLVAFVPLFGNHLTASRAHETMARELAVDMLESVAPYGILITAGDNDTFPLWYAQEVEGIRPDVTLANLSLMNTRWHLRQLWRRETPPFDPAHASPVWRELWQRQDVPGYPAGRPITPPTEGVLHSFSLQDVDALPELTPLPNGPVAVGADSVVMRVTGTPIAGAGNFVELSDLATIALIKDNIGKRPIYFSWTTGTHPDRDLGLTAYLVSEGLVRRVNPTPVRPTRTLFATPTMGYVDVEQTDRLLWNSYHWEEASRRRPRGWVDPPSASILTIYAAVYGSMAQIYEQAGDSVKAGRAAAVADGVQQNMPR